MGLNNKVNFIGLLILPSLIIDLRVSFNDGRKGKSFVVFDTVRTL